MSSRIIRGDDRLRKSNIRSIAFEMDNNVEVSHMEEIRRVEKQCYDQGYAEGERAGRQAGERMIETTARRYEKSIADLAVAHTQIVRMMETRTVEVALEIARKIIQREVSTDPDLVCALAMVALRRVQSQQSITLRISRHDFSRVHDAIAVMNGSIAIVEDPALERGDFMIDTAQTHLDGRLQSQVDSLGRAMLAD